MTRKFSWRSSLHVEQGYSRKFLFAGTLLLKRPNFVHKILLILRADLPERSVINNFAEAPFRFKNICRNGAPPRSGTTSPMMLRSLNPIRRLKRMPSITSLTTTAEELTKQSVQSAKPNSH